MNNVIKTGGEKIRKLALAALALGIVSGGSWAHAVEVWSNQTHSFEIVGDLHYGFFYHGVSITTENPPSYDPVSARGKSEIDFDYNCNISGDWSVGAKLEIRIGDYFSRRDKELARIELDENYIYLSSRYYGTLVLGSDKGAAGEGHVSAPEFLAYDLNSIEGQDFRIFQATLDEGRVNANGRHIPGSRRAYFYAKDETDIDYDEDVHKIIYYTPKLWGMQFGVSYAPDIDDHEPEEIARSAPVFDEDGNEIGRVQSREIIHIDDVAAGENADSLQERSDGIKDVVSLGLTYQNEINGIEMDASGGVLFGKRAGVSPDTFAWSIGARLGTEIGEGMARIGVGYLRGFEVHEPNLHDNVVIVGIAYQLGAWTTGIHYGWSKETIAQPRPQQARE